MIKDGYEAGREEGVSTDPYVDRRGEVVLNTAAYARLDLDRGHGAVNLAGPEKLEKVYET